ncbi:MAG TPA: hypothetical protein VGC20_16155 [bacterium]|jgi:hypothetical protein
MRTPSPDDRRPAWYRALERGFDVLLSGSAWLVLLWGLVIFALVGWGLLVLLFRPSP